MLQKHGQIVVQAFRQSSDEKVLTDKSYVSLIDQIHLHLD